MREDMFVCTCCGEEHPAAQRYPFGGQELCPHCLDEETSVCVCCGERIWDDDNKGSTETPLCPHCYDHYYTNCARCGTLLRVSDACYETDDDDEELPYCHSCHARVNRGRAINDYYYKPEPIFYGEGTRFFGVELEIDDAGESDSSAGELLDIANGNGLEHLYCKHDGSLDDGFELVTHPMSLPYHQDFMPWGEILQKAIEMGYKSHQSGTCGLHIHVNRSAFGNTEAQQEACIARILYFFEKHWEELLKFSRRTQRQLERWATRYGYKEQPKDILEHAKTGYHGGRYACVNLMNADTIEFRMFRGTLKFNTLIATLQLVDRVCDVALHLSDDELKAMPWTTFASGCQQFPELVQYLKERRLYVNEPVAAEEEM